MGIFLTQTGLRGLRGVTGRLRHWLASSLRRQLVAALVAGLAVASAVFLAILVKLYHDHLADERSAAAGQVRQLLRTALENAMLKRDIDGLREIVDQLGRQSEIAGVMILAPSGEVRFASEHENLGQRYDLAGGELCHGCALPEGHLDPVGAFTRREDGRQVLRSVVAVANREPCQTCHGPIATHPVNGILVVDYAAGELRRSALLSAITMGAAGMVVVGIAMLALWLTLERLLLRPLGYLGAASQGLAQGDYRSRAAISGHNELARLGSSFDSMAERIAHQIDDLAAREHYLQALINAVPDGIRVINRDYRVERVNRAFLEQQGLAADAVLGQPCHTSSHRCDTPCAPTMVTCPLHELGNGRNSLVCRHRHVRSDGHELFVEISAAILEVDDNGEPLSVVESIRNLSQDVALGHEQKLSELGMLAAGIAHEIRNPLSSIRIGLQALQGGSPSVDASSYLDLMQEEIDKCIEVTDRLLKLSVPTRGHDALVDLAVLVPDVMTLLASDAEQRGIAVDIDLPLSLRVIGSDSDLRMLVLNLAQNAFHAMVDGGRLKVTGKCDAGTVLIAMEDTGCGISPEHLERIFQPFWSRRADRGGTAGTGLGLSICREIVKAHGGRIEVESRLGEGTTFTVHIPWADGP